VADGLRARTFRSEAKAFFATPVDVRELPVSLLERFGTGSVGHAPTTTAYRTVATAEFVIIRC
jgi:hypothetical protein